MFERGGGKIFVLIFLFYHKSNRIIDFPVKVIESDCAQFYTPCDAVAVSHEKPRPLWLQRPLPSVCTLMQLTRLPLTLKQSHNFAYGLWNFLRYAILRTTCWNSRYFYFYNLVPISIFFDFVLSIRMYILHLNISFVRYFIYFTFYIYISHFLWCTIFSNFKFLNFLI